MAATKRSPFPLPYSSLLDEGAERAQVTMASDMASRREEKKKTERERRRRRHKVCAGEQESGRTGPTHQVGFVDWFGNVMSSKINKTAFALGRRLRWRPEDDDKNFCVGPGKTRVSKVKAKHFSYLWYFSTARNGLCCRTISTAAMRALDHEEEEGHEEEATLSIEARATKGPLGIEPKPGGPLADESAPRLITLQPSPLASPKCLPPPEHTVRPWSLSGSLPPCRPVAALPRSSPCSLSLSIPVPHPRPRRRCGSPNETRRGVALCGPRPFEPRRTNTHPPSINNHPISYPAYYP